MSSAKSRQQAGTPALTALTRAKVAHTLHAYDHEDPAAAELGYGMAAAQSLGIEPARVFKTLVASVDGALTVGVVPVDAQLDLKALASARKGKSATMADPALAQRTTGYVVGGISPLGQRKALPTVIDASAQDFQTILISAGRRGLDVELAPAQLLALTSGTFAPIARR